MSYSDLLTPRSEVLSEEGIEGIIDLANLTNKRKLEAKPKIFLNLTYPTVDIRRVIQNLNERFAEKGDTPGLFLFEGLKGCGKSHLLLLIYHLLNSPDLAKSWLNKHGLQSVLLPSDATIILNKFTDLPLFSIWDFIFEKVTSIRPKTSIVQPSLQQIQDILGDRQIILILDELEQGIRVIGDSAVRAQNIAFLQMLSEWANRSGQVTIFASIYSDKEEPGSTLKRVPSCRVNFAHAGDKACVVLHRIFENYLDFDPRLASGVIDSYINIWTKHISFNADQYRSKLSVSYPFLPELLELILERVPVRGGFQNVRGALGFLANMVRLTDKKVDIITAAHSDLQDREVRIRFSDLDTSGELITKVFGNLNELKEYSLASEIAAATLLYTLTGTGRLVGASREELLKHVLGPDIDINDFEKTLLVFQKYASHFHLREGRFYFDVEENADAKVEYNSLKVDSDKAKNLLHSLWRDEIFREPNCVIFTNIEDTKEILASLDKNRLRYVLAPRRLSSSEHHELYYGLEQRNQVILLEPRDKNFNLETNPDLLKWAKRQIAAEKLIGLTDDANRRNDYHRIASEDKRLCVDALKRAGLIFIRWEFYGDSPDVDRIEEETITGVSKDDVLHSLNQFFPIQLFEEHLSGRLNEILGRTVKDIDQEYRATLSFPVPATARSVSGALRSMCKSGKIGIRHQRGNFCGEDPQLTETEIFSATLDAPFETARVPRPTPAGGGEVESPTPGVVIAHPTFETKEIATPPVPSGGQLRQEIASQLQEYPDAKVTRVRLTIYLDATTGDLSSLPAGLRGSLSGSGSLSAEIIVTKGGEFSKAEVEQFVESLPSVRNADYSARLNLTLPLREEETEDA